jgi:hypothetical protein
MSVDPGEVMIREEVGDEELVKDETVVQEEVYFKNN